MSQFVTSRVARGAAVVVVFLALWTIPLDVRGRLALGSQSFG